MSFAKHSFLPAVVALMALTIAGCGGPDNLIEGLSNFWSLSCCGALIVILDIVALFELAGSPRSAGSKIFWALLIVFFPVGGCILYYVFGRS